MASDLVYTVFLLLETRHCLLSKTNHIFATQERLARNKEESNQRREAEKVEQQQLREYEEQVVRLVFHMSHVTRKPVFGVFDQVRLKRVCAATEAS